jgi:serine/threonine-protein kinase
MSEDTIGRVETRLMDEATWNASDIDPEPDVPLDSTFIKDIAHDYQILSLLGKGGMASVYLAKPVDRPHTRVAIKFSHSHKETHSKRLAREARVLESLGRYNVPYVPGLVAFLPEKNAIIMEYIRGTTLAEEYEMGFHRRSIEDKCGVLAHVAETLTQSHQHNIIHRDIKATNIMYKRETGVAYLIDWGLSGNIHELSHTAPSMFKGLVTEDQSRGITPHDILIGTPAYAPPEMLGQYPATLASDVYSFGVVCYEALTAILPRGGDHLPTWAARIHYLLQNKITDIRDLSDAPEDLCDIIMQSLSKERDDRPPIEDVWYVLQEVQNQTAVADSYDPTQTHIFPRLKFANMKDTGKHSKEDFDLYR